MNDKNRACRWMQALVVSSAAWRKQVMYIAREGLPRMRVINAVLLDLSRNG